jgi:hypothetical protein
MTPEDSNPIASLQEAIERHVLSEADAIREYERIARTSTDSLVATLMRMILEDERHHHAVFQGMESILADMAAGLQAPSAQQSVPDADSAAVLAREAAEERDNAARLLALARDQGDLCEGMFGLLLELMARDSQKHERILAFASQRMGGAIANP